MKHYCDICGSEANQGVQGTDLCQRCSDTMTDLRNSCKTEYFFRFEKYFDFTQAMELKFACEKVEEFMPKFGHIPTNFLLVLINTKPNHWYFESNLSLEKKQLFDYLYKNNLCRYEHKSYMYEMD